jgi:hypothetical protein
MKGADMVVHSSKIDDAENIKFPKSSLEFLGCFLRHLLFIDFCEETGLVKKVEEQDVMLDFNIVSKSDHEFEFVPIDMWAMVGIRSWVIVEIGKGVCRG